MSFSETPAARPQRVATASPFFSAWASVRGVPSPVLQLQFTVEDEGVFTMPWSATITYRRGLNEQQEFVCGENRREAWQSVRQAPEAAKPDF